MNGEFKLGTVLIKKKAIEIDICLLIIRYMS